MSLRISFVPGKSQSHFTAWVAIAAAAGFAVACGSSEAPTQQATGGSGALGGGSGGGPAGVGPGGAPSIGTGGAGGGAIDNPGGAGSGATAGVSGGSRSTPPGGGSGGMGVAGAGSVGTGVPVATGAWAMVDATQVKLLASFRYRFGALELGVLAGAELGLVKPHYFLLRSGEPEPVFSPWRLRPLANLSLGARF